MAQPGRTLILSHRGATRFSRSWIAPTARQSRSILALAVRRGIVRGAIYDALIAGAASTAGATLLSLDRRAERTYRDLDVTFEMLV